MRFFFEFSSLVRPVFLHSMAVVDMQATAGMPGTMATPPGMAIPQTWQDVTTVMMRNLPNKYTQRMLLSEINQAGFLGSFDFLYLPIDPETTANRGYAFLNFLDPSFAWMFKTAYDGRKMSRFKSTKVVSVMPATLQGFDANYAHYSQARVNRGDPAARPLFLREPVQSAQQLRQDAHNKSLRSNANKNRGNIPMNGFEPPQRPTPRPPPAMTAPRAAPGPPFVPEAGNGAEAGPPSMVPRFCPQCGGSIQASFQFCPHCGATNSLGREI